MGIPLEPWNLKKKKTLGEKEETFTNWSTFGLHVNFGGVYLKKGEPEKLRGTPETHSKIRPWKLAGPQKGNYIVFQPSFFRGENVSFRECILHSWSSRDRPWRMMGKEDDPAAFWEGDFSRGFCC